MAKKIGGNNMPFAKPDLLNFHPLKNTATTTIASQDLVKFLKHCGQSPEIIRL